MNGPEIVFFFWIVLLNPARIGGPGENHFYSTLESCEDVRAIIEGANTDIPGFRIAPKCIELKRNK